MMNCREATQLMSEAQERELALKERMALGMHTLMCKGCHNYKQQMTALRKITRAYAKGVNEAEEEQGGGK
ncbi:MAG: zf-HC2 domain-containing protein [Sideroxydans sp.]